jgi:flagellar hook assembly protein FlgD
MFRHLSRLIPTFDAAAALAVVIFIAVAPSARAQSVQLTVNTAWVHASESGKAFSCLPGPVPIPPQIRCPINADPSPLNGIISNDPEIQFEDYGRTRCSILSGNVNLFIEGTVSYNVCNSQVFLCTQIAINNPGGGVVALDDVEFEIFRFVDGSNPLDPASTPPLRTFFIDAPGATPNVAANSGPSFLPDANNGYCVMWDAAQAIQGGFGKINGAYGFRVTAQTNQQGASGNVIITQTRAYPSGFTRDSNDVTVSQKAITVDVTDVHVVRSTPTVVGQITGVSVEPYNFTYRLSKDATMYISILQSVPPYDTLRQVVPGLPRTSEGVLGTAATIPLVNGDAWDGRDSFGNILPPGNYLAVFQADASDQYDCTPGSAASCHSSAFVDPSSGRTVDPGKSDLSAATTMQIALDPLQITDIRLTPLLGGSTSLAVLTYLLSEPASVYVDIYPPGTQFCNDGSGVPSLTDINNPVTDGANVVKFLAASLDGCATTGVAPIRSISQVQQGRTSVLSFWDGRDLSGNLVGDGDYVFALYASLPSQAGAIYRAVPSDKRVWTSVAKIGFITVARGLVGLTQITPLATVIGSSPAVSGLNPFSFRYQVSRDAVVSLKIFDATGNILIKTLVNNETRPGLFNNVETWTDGTGDNGLVVSSGIYLVQLTAADPAFPAKVSTTTAQFPVDLFRITDVAVTPLLSGTSDQVILSYQLSQPMFVAWNIYPAGSVVVNSATAWPPCPAQTPPNACTSASVVTPGSIPAVPVVTFHGLRPGRLKISEFWDGRDVNGLFVPDGSYVFTLTAQSTTTPQYFPTDRVFGNITVARGAIIFLNFNVVPDVPQLFNSSNTITLDPYTISYTLSRQSSVTVQILNTAIPPGVVRSLVSGSVRQNNILQTDVWDGRDDRGNFPPSGFYLVRAVAVDVASVLSSGSTVQETISYDPLRIYDLAVTPLRGDGGGAVIAYQVSESMKVAIKIYKPGTNFDSSGNPSPPDSVSLVRVITGIRPARTAIQDTWDGRDFRLSQVPDGNYKFKIVGSTDPTAIDSITGNVLNPGVLAEDRLIDDLPVATNGSSNPESDFVNNTFAYPNPVTGPSATFSIYSPFRAKVILKLYTVAGQLVLSQDFGEIPPSFQNGPISYVWSKVNQSGRTVARGLYYAVIRIEETEGGANVLQTVKKVLVP